MSRKRRLGVTMGQMMQTDEKLRHTARRLSAAARKADRFLRPAKIRLLNKVNHVRRENAPQGREVSASVLFSMYGAAIEMECKYAHHHRHDDD